MSFSSHIKHNSLKKIVLKDVPCEEKLQELRKLLGMPEIENDSGEDGGGSGEGGGSGDGGGGGGGGGGSGDGVESGEGGASEDGGGGGDVGGGGNEAEEEEPRGTEGGGDVSEVSEKDEREKSFDSILSCFKGKYVKLAKGLLLEIEKSASVGWKYDSFEVTVDSNPILHSNIKLLLQKLMEEKSPTFPLGLHKFIQALIGIKLPRFYFRGSDARNIRQFLIDIGPKKVVAAVESSGKKRQRVEEEEEEEDKEKDTKRLKIDNPENEGENVESQPSGSRKRSREEEGEEETPDVEFDGRRRSSRIKKLRLNEKLSKTWSALNKK